MMNFFISVEKDGTVLEIHPTTLKAHMAAGWVEKKSDKAQKVEIEKIEEPQPESKPVPPPQGGVLPKSKK